MKLKKTKVISLELELMERVRDNDECIYIFKDINNIFNTKDNIIKLTNSYNSLYYNDYDDFVDKDDNIIRVFDNQIISLLYNGKKEFIEELILIIVEYLKENKLPYLYKDTQEDEFRFLTFEIEERISKNIYCGTYNSEYTGYSDKWEYVDGKFILTNKYLTKEKELDINDLEEVDKFILEFNKEWNSIIDGKFEWR